MHLLKAPALALGFDQDGREDQGNAGGGRHHVAKQAQRLGRTDRGDFPHVPNDRALGVEIGRHREQFSALGIFACNGGQDLRPDIARHQFAQPLVAEQAGSEQHADDAGIIEQALCYAAGVDLPQRVVVLGPEKRKRRNQAAGADARDDREGRAGAGRGPAVQHAHAIGAIGAAAGEREIGPG